MWLLRSLLVALLLPCVAALPSSYVPNARRSARMEPGSAIHLPQSYSHQSSSDFQHKVDLDIASASAQPGHLDRDRSSTAAGKKRELDPQGILRPARLRRDEVFPSVVAVNATSNENDDQSSGRTLTIVFEKADGTETNVSVTPPSRRWGQTATYLPAHNIVLVVGGQTSIAGDITNDVYALNASQLTSSQTSSSEALPWQRLSSQGLPAHAFAAATAAVDPTDGSEKLWIVGGVTQNCTQDAPAYIWSAPIGNVEAGKWTAVYPDDGATPSRRHGAKAVAIASTNAPSVMVSGGTFDASTCATTAGTYAGVDMWSESTASLSAPSSSLVSASAETAHVGIDITGSAYASVQSLALDPRMHDFSLTDYTTVMLPANGTCGEKVLFLGGKSENGQMAPLDRFWALDMATGDWEHWNATGLIPAGRMGHTAVVTPDGKVVIHGGYLQDPTEVTTENDPISEVFILDPKQSPARWDAAVWTSESSQPPALAYHSATMAADVMMVSFGMLNDGPATDYSAQSFMTSGQAPASQVHFLDTATMSNAGGLTWSTSAAGVAEARQAVANTVAAASQESSQAEAANAQQTAAASPVAAQPVPPAPAAPPASSVETKPEVAAPTPAAAPTDSADKPNQKDDASGTNTGSNHTGAIAGSLLGAAAVAAAIGGIYAYRKRKEAAAYNLGRDAGSRDAEADLARFHGDGEKGGQVPPVSNLYLNDGAEAAVAGGAGWSARLKRAASNLTRAKPESTTTGDKFTSAPKPVMTLGNIAPRRSAGVVELQREQKALPDDFIIQLAGDESPFELVDSEPLGRGELLMPTDDGRGELKLLHANGSRTSLATVSTLDSNAAASHFSYPYLAGMHRGSSPRSWKSEHSLSGAQRVRVILETPGSCYDQLHMSPGDVVSPYHLPRNPNASPDSLFLSFPADHAGLHDDDDLDTNVAVDGITDTPRHTKSPMFPWDTPAIAAPAPAKIIEPTHNGRTASMLRAQPTSLRVTNAW